MSDVPLSRHAHDVVQNCYKELHALIDSLSDVSSEERGNRLIDFVLKSRHRLARLLVSVRWFMSYSAFHSSAQTTRQIAATRSDMYMHDADGLFSVYQATQAASSLPSALAEAAEILGPSKLLRRLPRVIESSIGLDLRTASTKAPSTSPSVPTAPVDGDIVMSEHCNNDKFGNAHSPVHSGSSESISDSDDDVTNEAMERLRATTHRVVVDSLPPGVRVLQPGVGENGVAVRIGVPDVWSADIVLDGVKEEASAVRVLAQQIYVDGNPDAPTGMHSRRKARNATERTLPLRNEKNIQLRALLNDRLYFVSQSLSSDLSEPDRIKQVFFALARVMSLECSAGIAMAHIRSQAGALLVSRAWKESGLHVTGRWQDERLKLPMCTLTYWPRSHLRSTISVCAHNIHNEGMTTSEEDAKMISRIIDIKHDPPLSGQGKYLNLRLNSLNLQELLLDCGRMRARNELSKIVTLCNAEFEKDCLSANLVSNATCESVLAVFDKNEVALVFKWSLTTGGLSVRPRGIVACALNPRREGLEKLNRAIWDGEKFFQRSEAIWSVVKVVLQEFRHVFRQEAVIRGFLACGGDVLPTWPPGVSQVVKGSTIVDFPTIAPPFTTVERKRARSFISLTGLDGDTPDNCKRQRRENSIVVAKLQNNSEREEDKLPSSSQWRLKRQAEGSNDLATSPKRRKRAVESQFGLRHKFIDGMVFFEGLAPSESPSSSKSTRSKALTANRICRWLEVRHDAESRYRREPLLNSLAKSGVITSWDSNGPFEQNGVIEVPVSLRALPMDVGKAVVQFRGDEEWSLRLKLRKDIFDEGGISNVGPSYRKDSRILQFSYANISKSSVQNCVREVIRARTAATLILSLLDQEKGYKVLEKQFSHVTVESSGKRLMVGLGNVSLEVEAWPKSEVFRTEVAPLMEEILSESRREMGRMLSMMLKMTIPMVDALEKAILIFSPVAKCYVRLSTVFRARLVVVLRTSKKEPTVVGVDIDGHRGNGRVIIYDVGRARKAKEMEGKAQKQETSAGSASSAAQPGLIPMWEAIVKNLGAKKLANSIGKGLGMEIDVTLLFAILKTVVQSILPKAGLPPSSSN